MSTTTKYGFPRLAGTDLIPAFPTSTFNAFVDMLDAITSTIITTNPRPAAGKPGRWHLDAAGILSFDTGVTWITIAQEATVAAVEIGVQQSYAGSVLPDPAGDVEYRWADGSLLVGRSSTYAAFFARVGHSYNGGVDPGSDSVRLPDKRGRESVGADAMPGGSAAGRLPNSNRARGQSGGAEQTTLTGAQSGVPAHAVAVAINDPQHGHDLGSLDYGSGGAVLSEVNNTIWVAANNSGGARAIQQTALNGTSAMGLIAKGASTGISATAAASAAAAAAGHSNLNPYEVDNWIVRVR